MPLPHKKICLSYFLLMSRYHGLRGLGYNTLVHYIPITVFWIDQQLVVEKNLWTVQLAHQSWQYQAIVTFPALILQIPLNNNDENANRCLSSKKLQ